MIITSKADDRTSETIEYLYTHWGTTVRNNFANKFKRCLRIIKDNPYSFGIDQKEPRLRRCVITPLNVLYYAIDNKDIIIISLEDTRMNPENRRLI